MVTDNLQDLMKSPLRHSGPSAWEVSEILWSMREKSFSTLTSSSPCSTTSTSSLSAVLSSSSTVKIVDRHLRKSFKKKSQKTIKVLDHIPEDDSWGKVPKTTKAIIIHLKEVSLPPSRVTTSASTSSLTILATTLAPLRLPPI